MTRITSPHRAIVSLGLLALAGAPATAHAGGDAAATAAAALEPFFNQLPPLRESPAERAYATLPDARACKAAVAAARSAKLADSARIYSSELSGWRDAHHDDDQHYLTLAEASAVCAEYAALVLMIPAAAAQAEAATKLALYSSTEPGSLGKDLGEQMIAEGRRCLAATDAAIAAGAPADRPTLIGERELTLAAGRAATCQALVDFGAKLGGAIAGAHAAERERIAAKYRAAGIKGQRLEAFIDNDSTHWRVKGCAIESEVARLKKAAKLYQLLEHADGTYAIRTYTFKGDKLVGVRDRAFATLAKAQRGCT